MLLPWLPGLVTSAYSFRTHRHRNNYPNALDYADQHGCNPYNQPYSAGRHRYGYQYNHTQPYSNIHTFTDLYIVAHAYAFSHAFTDIYPDTYQLANGDIHGLIYAVTYEYPDSNHHSIPVANPIT